MVRVTAKVMEIEHQESGKVVGMLVTAPKGSPQMVRENRARARAAVAVGLFDTVKTASKALINGDLERRALVMSHKREDMDNEGMMGDFVTEWAIRVKVRGV